MKKILLLLIVLNTFSCKKIDQSVNKEEFKGLGKLLLGREFNKLEYYDHFQLDSDLQMITYDSVYCIAKYDVSKEYGIIENLNVGVKDGKIFWVHFNKGIYTHNYNIDNYFDTKLILKEKPKRNSSSSDEYLSIDNSISAFVGIVNEKHTYSYINERILQSIRNTEDSLFNIENRKRIIKAKQEYMKDMPTK